MILDQFRIDGKVALVTGGTKGIGGAIARALAEAGADVAVVSRQGDPEIEKAIRTTGKRYLHYPADLTKRNETKAVIPAIFEKMGHLDILVNNAGICPRAPVLDFSEADWDATLEINLTANFILSQGAARLMIKKKEGKIINVASILAFQGGINIPAYTASKHGLAGLTKAFSNAWPVKGSMSTPLPPDISRPSLRNRCGKIKNGRPLSKNEFRPADGGFQTILPEWRYFWPPRPPILFMGRCSP